MLKQNGHLHNQLPLRFMGGGTISGNRANFGRGDMRNWFCGGHAPANIAGTPYGYLAPASWRLPMKPGALGATGRTLEGSGTVASATAQSGYNIDAEITGSGGVDNVSAIGLIVSMAAVITASGGISSATTQALATMVAGLTGSGSVSATAQGLAELGAALTGSGSVNANNTALMDIAAQIRGYGDLTPEGIRDTVWSALLSQYQADGTAGKTLSVAGSGGVDYDALWASMPAALKESLAAYVLAAAQVDPISANIKEVNDTTIDGAGTAGDPWGPA